jgi:hypothetical protein
MDILTSYRQIIQDVLLTYTRIPYAYGDVHCKPLFDREHDSYALMTLGWQGVKRIHGCLVHVEIIDDKVWIQRDDTDGGIAYQLVAAGIPKQQIVLGFHTPDVRPYTEYAVA